MYTIAVRSIVVVLPSVAVPHRRTFLRVTRSKYNCIVAPLQQKFTDTHTQCSCAMQNGTVSSDSTEPPRLRLATASEHAHN